MELWNGITEQITGQVQTILKLSSHDNKPQQNHVNRDKTTSIVSPHHFMDKTEETSFLNDSSEPSPMEVSPALFFMTMEQHYASRLESASSQPPPTLEPMLRRRGPSGVTPLSIDHLEPAKQDQRARQRAPSLSQEPSPLPSPLEGSVGLKPVSAGCLGMGYWVSGVGSMDA